MYENPHHTGAHHHRGSVGVAGAQPTEMPLAEPPQAQQAAGAGVEEGRWVEARSSDGRMTTAYLKMPGSRVLGLRGKAVVDHHISAILNVFLNTSKSTEWIRCETDGVVVDFSFKKWPDSDTEHVCTQHKPSYLDHVEEYATPKRNKHVIYQFFDMPWPLGDREFLMERAVEADRRARTVVAKCTCVGCRPDRCSEKRGHTHPAHPSIRPIHLLPTHPSTHRQVHREAPRRRVQAPAEARGQGRPGQRGQGGGSPHAVGLPQPATEQGGGWSHAPDADRRGEPGTGSIQNTFGNRLL